MDTECTGTRDCRWSEIEMTKKRNQSSQKETALDMMKRVFAVAELIIQSETYQKKSAQKQKIPTKTQD